MKGTYDGLDARQNSQKPRLTPKLMPSSFSLTGGRSLNTAGQYILVTDQFTYSLSVHWYTTAVMQ